MRLSLLLCLLITGTSVAQTTLPTYTVATLAGADALGDGGWAANAVLRWPQSLAFDLAGNLYIADGGNASIRKVAPNGVITTFAGNGLAGYGGDGGPADRAQLSALITALAVDARGNVYICDAGNRVVRKVSAADGKISTFVNGPTLPTPITGYSMDGLAVDSAGNLYLALAGKHQVDRFAPDGTFSYFAGNGTSADTGDGGPASQASFESPFALYMDSSDTLYVSDTGANRIRKITPDGTVSSVAGSGKVGFGGDGGPATQALLDDPQFMTMDAAGSLYVIDINNYRVRRIATDGTITTIAGTGAGIRSGDGGPATKAGFGRISGIAMSPAGNLYLSDYDSAVRVITPDGIINTAYGTLHFAEDGALAENALLNFPEAMVGDGQGNLYFDDWFRVRKIDTNGVISTIAGSISTITGTVNITNTGDGGPATSATMTRPYSLALDTAGNVYFNSGNVVRRVGTDGIITTVAGGGKTLGDGGPATSASLSSPQLGLAVDPSGSLYISDTGNHRIRKVTPDGNIATLAGTGTAGSTGDGGPAVAANINTPYGLAFDAAGNLYFADYSANRVRVILPDGTISTFAGTGTAGESGDGGPATQAKIDGPYSVAVDSAGNVYICDYLGIALRVVTPDGIIHTIASGQPTDIQSLGGFGGDGGPAIGNHFSDVTAVAFDGSGNIYLLDNYNERIRVLIPNQ